MSDVFLEEYQAHDNVIRYLPKTAGHGINYVLEHVYGPIYIDLARELMKERGGRGLRILEYGCGGGMNLLWLLRRLKDLNIPVEFACGTDFAPAMVEAATANCAQSLPDCDRSKVAFYPVPNESLASKLPTELMRAPKDVLGSFDLILGVNTFRYCFRGKDAVECARGLLKLLGPGGYSVMIDMNHSFPFFRSRFKNRDGVPPEQYYLPTLHEYVTAFETAGFEIRRQTQFCWIHHSAGPTATRTLAFIAPALNAFFRRWATRSLVIAKRPA